MPSLSVSQWSKSTATPSLPLNAGSSERLPQPNQHTQGEGKLSQQKGCSPCQTRVHQPTKASLSGGATFTGFYFLRSPCLTQSFWCSEGAELGSQQICLQRGKNRVCLQPPNHAPLQTGTIRLFPRPR